jgi:succinate dehydrogenase/fumarate reductase flavoprotein subunit
MERGITRRSLLGGALGVAAGAASAGMGSLALAASTESSAGEVGNASSASSASAADGTEWNAVYDVVVIGFGGAGAVSAITAAEEGAKVLLIDKAPVGHEGGNTRYCMQVVVTIPTDRRDDAVTYYKALREGKLLPSDEQIEAWVDMVVENEQWLKDHGGNPQPMYESGSYPGEFPEYPQGDSVIPMTNNGMIADSGMWRLLRGLVTDRSDSIDVWYEAPATALVRDPATGVVTGVTVGLPDGEANVRARSGVVLACGGFEANQQMVQDYFGLDQIFAMGTQYNTGDGIRMASAVGANLWHMENIMGPFLQTYYPGFSRPEFWSGTLMSASWYAGSFLFVGADGTRFVNEKFNPRHGYVLQNGVFRHSPAPLPVYMVFDQPFVEQSQCISQTMAKSVESQIKMGVVKSAETLEELAGQIGLDPAVLAGTVERFGRWCDEGYDPECGRDISTMQPLSEEGPYYAIELKAAMINTQGGPQRDKNAQVIDTNGDPIPHLYEAGECGAMFSGLYQGASNIADCIATRRVAGTNAAAPKIDDDGSDVLLGREISAPEPAEKSFETAQGQYIGKAEGMCGDLYVRVTLDGDTISQVEVVDQGETDTFGGWPVKLMPERFAGLTADQVMDVDGVTMATMTSNAIKLAVSDALEKAGKA